MLSVRDIETKTFSRSKTGYKEEEVEAFLDEIIVDYTALLEEKESLGKKVIVLSEKLETIRDEQEARMQSLLSTQKSYDEVMRTAKMNAESLINDAKKKADEESDSACLKFQIYFPLVESHRQGKPPSTRQSEEKSPRQSSLLF